MGKGRPFAVFDIDGTLIRWQLYHAIADAMVKLGYLAPHTYHVVKDARMDWKRRTGSDSFKSYEKQLIDTYEKVLKELTMEQFMKAADVVFHEYKDQVYTYTRDLITELKKKNYLLFAISGSQIEIVEKISRHWGFDDWVGTVYNYKGGRFTGTKIVASHDKAKALKELVNKHGASLKDSVAVGDSSSDIAMLEMAEKPIVFNPENELFKYAKGKAWKIVIERKNMVYELEKVNGRYELVKTNV
ncbi:MAG TPA: HAD family phosphatase [Candidatus Saccharimonadales bacterium]